MIERKRIGLYYESYSNFPALVIYIQNIVRTLNEADDREKPHLTILHRSDSPLAELKAIGYNYMSFYPVKFFKPSLLTRAFNKIGRTFFSGNFIEMIDRKFPRDLEVIFPYTFQIEAAYVPKKIVWKPDFQEIHLPLFFSTAELNYDLQQIKKIENENCELVFSSEDASRDFLTLVPDNAKKIHLWKFTSYLPDFSKVNLEIIKSRFNIPDKYFLVANQFWPHKNHLNVLKAIKECKKRGLDTAVVFTGKQTSLRDPELFQKLIYFAEIHGLTQHIRYTGFISREEQLCLMKHADAVIQPSLFEGWSTVIEDSKAMGQYVIASDIAVNREQIKNNVSFFDPHNYIALADCMTSLRKNKNSFLPSEYVAEIEGFRNTVLKTFNSQ